MTTGEISAPGRSLGRLAGVGDRADRLRHHESVPARAARYGAWPEWADESVVAAYRSGGVERPWLHQQVAADAVWSGTHTVLSTGTASGKSLAYQLPGLTAIRTARRPRGQRGAGVLYLAPTKALAHDQAAALRALGTDVRVSTHDGDSSPDERAWTAEFAEWVLTNPDMLHRSLLPRHDRWADFLSRLRLVVVDESHHYRGVFGAHVAQILRRLRRVCASYSCRPTFVLASATAADPAESAGRLTGLDVVAVSADHSPRGALTLGLWEPPLTSYAGENGAPVRRGAAAEAADLLADLVSSEVSTLAFVRSRRGVEQVAATAAAALEEVQPGLGARVGAYRGGYLPEERRAIEADLRAGRLTGLAATNALELGIDVSGLDAVLLAGYPGTRAAFWQQVGRAGRSGGDALGLLIAKDDPLDTYLLNHPDALLRAPVEATVFDTTNPHVLSPHLCAAAQEIPLTDSEVDLFGPTARECLEDLTARGLLRRRRSAWYWTSTRRAADLADIRSTGGAQVQLVEAGTGRVIGTVDGGAAHSSAHAGAVYVHRGEPWLVRELDLAEHVAELVPAPEVTYSTVAREVTDIRIARMLEQVAWGSARVAFGEVQVSHQVVSFLKRRVPGGEVVAEEPLDLPARTLVTRAVWWTVPDEVLDEAGLEAADRAGAAHAAEHCSIGLLPLVATCDRWDIGGVSTVRHPDTGLLTVFVHDGHPGGAGFAERGYAAARDWLSATRETIADCQCLAGCPSCIQSPKCGNQNNPLDKSGAVLLLDVLLARHG